MAEYIEREALLDSICHEMCRIAFCGATNCAFMAKVCSAPAADVAPVVRCKGCKHLVAVNVNGKGIPTCRVSGMEVAPDEFCSRGEAWNRRADDG